MTELPLIATDQPKAPRTWGLGLVRVSRRDPVDELRM